MALFARTVARALGRLGLDHPGDITFPRSIRPMLATLGRTPPFDDLGWTYEPKWDGFRVIAMMRDGSAQLFSRNLHPFTNLFRPIAEALKDFPTSLVLDGEVVVIGRDGRPDFEALQGWLRPAKKRPVGRLAYIVFDCLYVNGHSLLSRPLEERQKILHRLAPALRTEEIRVTDAFPGDQGTVVFKATVEMGLEGVVAKHRQSVYRPGMRSREWVKVPVRQRDEFVVGGFLAPSPDHLSTLIVGQYDCQGKLRYAGMVGTGLPEETRRVILRELRATRRKTSPFVPAPTLRDHFGELRTDLPPQWVKPTLVVDVEYRERTSDGLRHAALKGLRPDKNAREVEIRLSLSLKETIMKGKYALPILLLPDAVLGKNLPSVLPPSRWWGVRIATYDRAHYQCSACGAKERLYCHEVWAISKCVIRLTKIVALCGRCHAATHLYPDTPGKAFDELARHWCKVNGCSRRTFNRYYSRKQAEYLRRKDQLYKIKYGRFARLVRKRHPRTER